MKKAALHNLGCKVNSYETEAMQQLLAQAGYEIVPFEEYADVYVVNTCSVTNIADKKSRQMLHRAKKRNPDAVVVAAGCYVQTAGEVLEQDAAVDILIGNNKKGDLPKILEDYEWERRRKNIIDINAGRQPYEELKVDSPMEHTRAFLKVQDGCNQFCSYCIIPYARGRVRSRALSDVAAETEELAKNGYQEIVLTGIHLSSYGTDLGCTLLDLIRTVHRIKGVKRIRLGSLEPGIITPEFVRELAALPKVCPHFHLSLQSGSDTVLRRMNRKYGTAEYLEKCRIIRSFYEHPALTTDIIVGFPGETEEEFAQTCAFVREAGFYEIHVFKYSRRSGTVAAKMPDQIPEKVKAVRSGTLIGLAQELKEVFIRWYEGKRVEVLFEEAAADADGQYFVGFTPEYVKCRYRSEENMANRIMEVEFLPVLY